MNMRVGWCILLIAASFTTLFLSGMNLFWGELNADEGWYLYAARLASEGARPYHDFAFTQGPVFPRVYAWVQPWVDTWGVLAGRVFSALLGFLAVAVSAWTAARLAPATRAWHAAVVVFVLLGCNVYHSYFSLVVKTYSLSAVWVAGGSLAFTFMRGTCLYPAAAAAGFLWALAAGVRLSSGLLLAVGGFGLLLYRGVYPRAWVAFGMGGIAGLMLAYAPSWIADADNTRFWLLSYHAARDAGTWSSLMVYKAGFLSRFVQSYFVVITALALLLAIGFVHVDKIKQHVPVTVRLLFAGFIAVTLIHFLAPFPYDDYQVFIMPLLAICVGWGIAYGLQKVTDGQCLLALTVLYALSTAAAFSSPMNQQWFVRERDRIWWLLKDKADLVVLQDAGRWLKEQADPDDVVLTHDTYLAVESGLRIVPGTEMGPFSYYPDWTREEAEKRKVMNQEMLAEALEQGNAEWVALSGYSFAIRSPSITPLEEHEKTVLHSLLMERYEKVKTFPYFGQAHTTLDLYRLKPQAE